MFGFLACGSASCLAGVPFCALLCSPFVSLVFFCFPCASLCAAVGFLLGLAKVWLVALLPALLVCPLCPFVFLLCFLLCVFPVLPCVI